MNITSAVWGMSIIASSASAIGRVPARQLHSLTLRDVNHVGIALAWATLVSVLEFCFCLFVCLFHILSVSFLRDIYTSASVLCGLSPCADR